MSRGFWPNNENDRLFRILDNMWRTKLRSPKWRFLFEDVANLFMSGYLIEHGEEIDWDGDLWNLVEFLFKKTGISEATLWDELRRILNLKSRLQTCEVMADISDRDFWDFIGSRYCYICRVKERGYRTAGRCDKCASDKLHWEESYKRTCRKEIASFVAQSASFWVLNHTRLNKDVISVILQFVTYDSEVNLRWDWTIHNGKWRK